MNGLVRVLAHKHEQLVWLVNARYVHTVRRMMADVENLRVTGTSDYSAVADFWLPYWPNSLRLGFFRTDESFDQAHWDQEFYRHADVEFEARWRDFRFAERIPEQRVCGRLIHEDPSRGYLVSRGVPLEQSLFVTSRPCALDWLPEILGARELHFIDSSFLNLAESLYALGYLRNTRLVFHRYAKVYPGPARWPALRAPWEILE